jgi:hypothetical protein
VRRHLSRIKGGRLAAIAGARGADLHSFVISDVVGDDPALVASGPSIGAAFVPEQAIAILAAMGWPVTPALAAAIRANQPPPVPVHPVRLIATNADARAAIAARAAADGWQVVDLGGASLRVVAGAYGEAKGPARTFSPLHVWDVEATAGADLELAIAAGDTVMVALFSGAVSIDGREVRQAGLLTFDTQGDTISLTATTDAKLLVLTGTPLNEPIAHYGPFVMNTEAEIRAAIDDFRRGKMGNLDAFAS